MAREIAISEKPFPSRIQLVIHGMTGGGSERQMACLANDLIEQSDVSAVRLWTIAGTDADRYPLNPKIERVGLNQVASSGGMIRGLQGNLQRSRQLRASTLEWKPDVVASFCDTTNILTLHALAKHFPIVISERSDPRKQRLSRIWEFLRSVYYPKATRCVAQSDEVQDYLQKRYYSRFPDRVLTIPSAIHLPGIENAFTKHAKSKGDIKKHSHRICLYVGRLAPEKRVDRLIDAWSHVANQVANQQDHWKLRIVGEGPFEKDLIAQANRLGLQKSIQFRPWTSDIVDEYVQADMFVMSSDYEGLPQSLLEAMTVGLPVVVTDCSPAIRDLFEQSDIGILVRNNDLLGEALLTMVRDAELRERCGSASKSLSQRYQWSAVSRQWHSVLVT